MYDGCARAFQVGWKGALLAMTLLAGDGEAATNANGRMDITSPFGLFAVFPLEFSEFQTDMGYDDPAFIQWAATKYLDVGAKYSRMNTLLTWEVIEPTLGFGYTWSCGAGSTLCGPDDILGETYANAGSGNLDMMMVINPKRGSVLDVADVTRFKAFVQAAVERYDGDGVGDADPNIRVKYWQAFNEPFDEWINQGGTYDGYVRFVRSMSEAVRAADPDAKVVLGAVFSTTRGHMDRNARQVIYRLRNEKAFDIADIHHWGNKDDWRITSATTLRKVLDRSGYGEAAIWATEVGTFTGTATDVSGTQTESDQAISLVKRFVYNLAHNVDKVYWNNLIDWRCFNGNCGKQYDNMGLVSDGTTAGEASVNPGTTRLAYYTYKLMVETLNGSAAQELEIVKESQGAYVYGFRLANSSNPTYVAWRESQSGDPDEVGSVTFSVEGTGSYTMMESIPNVSSGASLSAGNYPNFFNSSTVTPSGGSVTIQIGLTPVYLVP